MFRFRTLGAVDLLASDGRAIQAILAQPRRVALLAYLALAGTRGFLRRDQLLALFWPELDEAHARAALSRAIYTLRQSLGEGVLLRRGDDEIGLAGDRFECDAVAFQAAVAERRWQDAVELYCGDLLDGFFVSDAPGFEAWLEIERDRLRRLANEAGWALADAHRDAGSHALAARWARWAVERSPYDEIGIQRLMKLLDAAGDRAGAVRAYQDFSRRLADELELEPSPETRAQLEAIRARDSAANGVIHLASAEAHDVDATPPIPLTDPTRTTVRPRRRMLALAAIGTVLIGTFLFARGARSASDPSLVVLVRFENRTGDPAFDALAARVTEHAGLGISMMVHTLRPPAPGGVLRSEHDPDGGSDMRRTARKRRAGTTVGGWIDLDARDVRIHARLLRVGPGAAPIAYDTTAFWIAPPVSRGTEQRALDEMRQRIMGGIAVFMNPSLASWFPLATPPPRRDAYEELQSGNRVRAQRDVRDHQTEAIAHYRRAAALDTTLTWALLQAVPLYRPFDRAAADSILEVVEATRARLLPLQADYLDFIRAQPVDPVDSYRAARRLAERAPVFLPMFANSARFVNRPRETLEVLDRVEKGRSRRNRPPAFVLQRANAHHQLHQHEAELAIVRAARRAMPTSLEVLFLEVAAGAALGRSAHVLALLDTALSMPRDPHYDPGNIALHAAKEFRAHGHPEPASAAIDWAFEWYRARPPNEAAESLQRGGLATAAYIAGCFAKRENERRLFLAEADSLFQLVLAEDSAQLEVQGLIGAIAALRGDRSRAESILSALERSHPSGKPPWPEVFYAEATIRAALGQTDAAVSSLRDWVGGQGFDVHAEPEFASLKDHPGFRDFIRPKG